VIADTSAWVEFLRATGSRCHHVLIDALQREQTIWMPPVVLQGILQGARDAEHFVRLELQFEQLPGLDTLNPRDIARDAALLYARCRWRGNAVRSPNDCVVAVCAIVSQLPLLAQDRDFETIARIEPALTLV
jgi:predicted nucleic acid-binding protein